MAEEASIRRAEIFELKKASLEIKLTNWGATVISLLVPDAHGNAADVVLGFDSLHPYLEGKSAYFGCVVGRVANRIRAGRFTLDGVDYVLPLNNPPNSLHGGHRGFDKVLWSVAAREDGEVPSITFHYVSPDGEEGYPGEVEVTVKYSLPSSSALRVDMAATAKNKATPVNLAQHSYWNLAGHGAGDVLDHRLTVWATHITPLGPDSVPTGEIKPVAGTPFDFTVEERIGERIGLVAGGYDHNFVLSGGEERLGLRRAARLREPGSGRAMEVWTDAPGMQLYSGNFLDGVAGKGGAVYGKHAGVCLETQGFPNAVNQPEFPSVIVRPGQEYRHSILYEFATAEPVP